MPPGTGAHIGPKIAHIGPNMPNNKNRRKTLNLTFTRSQRENRRRKRIRERIFRNAGYCCAWCGVMGFPRGHQAAPRDTDLDIDHIVPRFLGGTGAQSNLQVLCQTCHRRKSRSDLLWALGNAPITPIIEEEDSINDETPAFSSRGTPR